ncbi:RNA recognition motif-containing protein [Grosmannia clavigera kw1407]|uniref:RNA recognition motif-containing protein n=1 Tax=Grosmannia clavigera (strain kw1407 / UAMH 11150) TaxID=655863 RepID=F0XS89_GROCL|nr:RNA recognition motif-containing protein [Grosmannia clavigera kw1407]EFW99425.1 RNA recognition motif-containing protein [Grosmannia clavigera kw1407]
MAVRPGEENVATLFGDIHYFYGPETDNPPHHRFDKGSYVYLFENAVEGRTRIEVANRPGTELQDAFDGYLDCTAVSYSYRHSCMVSLTVHDVPNQEEWHLPTYDPQNQNIYHYKLHSLDIYFWTPRDALQFVNGVRRLLPASQLDIEDEPLPPPPPPLQQQQQHYGAVPLDVSVSPVVQKLESVALSEGSVATAAPAAAAMSSFAAPPLSAISADSGGSRPSQGSTPAPAPAPAFVPMAYNPAAPAAPETIRPREKTPPPEDAVPHNPLHQTLVQDASTPFSPGLVVPMGLGPLSPGVPPPAFAAPPGAPAFPAFPGPPPNFSPGSTPVTAAAGAGTPHPGHPGLVRAGTMPASPFSPNGFPGGPSFAAPTTTNQYQHTPTPPPGSAAALGGYSQYSYSTSSTTLPAAGEYSVHHQLYQPTGGEAVSHQPKQDPRGRFEENAGRIERGVSGMLKKLEKKFA